MALGAAAVLAGVILAGCSPGTSVTATAGWSSLAEVPDTTAVSSNFEAVDCPSAQRCLAFTYAYHHGTYNDGPMTVCSRLLDGARWSAPTVVENLRTSANGVNDTEGYNGVHGLTCASAEPCFAWDENDRLLTYDGKRWLAVPYPSLLRNGHISCGDPRFCLIDDADGDVQVFEGRSWSRIIATNGKGYAIGWTSCVASGECFALNG